MSEPNNIQTQIDQLGEQVRVMITEMVEKGVFTEEMLDVVLMNTSIFMAKTAKAALQVASIRLYVDSQFLEGVTTFTVGSVEKFDAANFFINDSNKQPDRIKLWLESDFTYCFLKKVETCVSPATIRVHKIKKSAFDEHIIPELGGEEIVETTLFHFYEMLKKQPKGEKGALLTNGDRNIFYIRDADGKLQAIYCKRRKGQWHIDAYLIPDINRDTWPANSQVFSR